MTKLREKRVLATKRCVDAGAAGALILSGAGIMSKTRQVAVSMKETCPVWGCC